MIPFVNIYLLNGVRARQGKFRVLLSRFTMLGIHYKMTLVTHNCLPSDARQK